MPTLRLVTDATAEPVTLADLKIYIGLSTVTTVEDTLLNSMEKAARHYCENYTKKPCLPQTFQLIVDEWPENDEFTLPRYPLSTSTADVVITYLDAVSGNSTTLNSTVYGIDHYAEPPRIFLNDGSEWPSHYTQRNAITVQFIAGCTLTTAAPATDNCPEEMETWIKMRVKQMYDNRDIVQHGNITIMANSYVDGLLDAHKMPDVRP